MKYSWRASLVKRLCLKLAWPIWRLVVGTRYRLTGDCGMACGHVEPYGFVPEVGCPIHDI